jgi:hypothetical protein
MGAHYSKLFEPKPYDEAGTRNFAELSAELNERASKVVDLLPQDQRTRFKSRMERYGTWDVLPNDLKQLIMDAEAGRPVQYTTVS